MSVSSAPQLTWTNIVATIAVFCVMAGGGYKIIASELAFQRELGRNEDDDLRKQIEQNRRDIEAIRNSFLTIREHTAYQHEQTLVNNEFRDHLTALELGQRELIAHQAHTPVESKEVDVLSASIDKRFESEQQQINDINRQIAASILLPGHQLQPQSKGTLP